ncbi:lamin tail domain-containing protein 2 isoform X2 [Ascaphus truei]|uniref:lamin tail domain-containing protein 2 isoform X2 n=1 Tax=Ascaphus truei TaxID=8439 RepID=UPI003F5907BF
MARAMGLVSTVTSTKGGVRLTQTMNGEEEDGSAYTYTQGMGETLKGQCQETKLMPTVMPTLKGMDRYPCPLQIAEVNSLGLFIRICNSSPHQHVDLSGYVLRQIEDTHPISFYRFPLNTHLSALQHITVWASAAKVSHNPPTDLVWKRNVSFRSNPQCITVLSRPSGQPVAFYRAVHSPPPAATGNPTVSLLQEGVRRPIESPDIDLNRNRCVSAPRNLNCKESHTMSYRSGVRQRPPLTPRFLPGWTHRASSPTSVLCSVTCYPANPLVL